MLVRRQIWPSLKAALVSLVSKLVISRVIQGHNTPSPRVLKCIIPSKPGGCLFYIELVINTNNTTTCTSAPPGPRHSEGFQMREP
jgi:hypothetical protein